MIGRFAVALLMSALLPAGFAAAAPAKPAATQPLATQPAAAAASTKPAGAVAKAAEKAAKESSKPPATTKEAKEASKYPTPAELWEKINSLKAAQDKLAKVAYFDLDQPVTEKPAAFSLFGDNLITVHTLIDRLHKARDDKGVRAVLITLGATDFNLAQAQEIRLALDELRKAGKRTFVYADGYDTAAYTAASGATDICLLGGGEIMIPGVGMETMFYKGLFDKLGVKADYVQIGEYKGADESYTRSAPSEELRGELNKITESIYAQLIDGIALHRNLGREEVKALIDECILTGKTAKDRKLVDHLVDPDGLRALIKDELNQDINLVANYGAKESAKLDFSSPFAFFQSLNRKPAEESKKPAVALIHAEGVIVDGEGDTGLFGGGENVGGEAMRKAFRLASRDDNVKAIVLRIDSPGGSALASEVVWQAARHAADKKPLIISIGSMAASGGYYLASSGDYIFADPSAIVGSIGVVGGKFVLKDLFDKLGLTTETFTKGRNAGLFSSNHEFTDRQRRMVTNWMRQTYDQFTERVMTYRAGKIKDIDQVARGRIFIAQQAKELGMVDELGGIEEAIAYAAAEAELKAGEYDVKLVPAPKTLADLFNGSASSSSAADEEARLPFAPKVSGGFGNVTIAPQITIAPDSLLRIVSPQTRRLIGQQIQFMQMLDKRPVLLVAPYVMTLK